MENPGSENQEISEHEFGIQYNIIPGKFKKSELREGHGACDAIVTHAIVFPVDGTRNEAILSSDADGKPLPTHELLRSWYILGVQMMNNGDLLEPSRSIVIEALNKLKQHVTR